MGVTRYGDTWGYQGWYSLLGYCGTQFSADKMKRPAAQRLESIEIYLHRCERGSVHRYFSQDGGMRLRKLRPILRYMRGLYTTSILIDHNICKYM